MTTRIILSAGMPRSGSTWLFNAVRLLLLKANFTITAKWIDDFIESDLSNADVVLIKLHDFNLDWVDQADFVVYSYRDIRDALASIERKFGHTPTLELANDLIDIDYKWKKVTNFVMRYESLDSKKESILNELAKQLGLHFNKKDFTDIQNELDNMKYSDSKYINERYNLINLLHVNHITHGGYGTWKGQVDDCLISEIEQHCLQWFIDFDYKMSI